MASLVELLLVLASAFGFNLIPFAGPSNLFIASNAALLLPSANPIVLGFLVALGAALAKSVHYMVTFFVSKHLSEKRRKVLDSEKTKVKKWAFLLLFVAAASPIPDEPVVIPLGLLKYSPARFFTAFFLGKLSITIAGAYLGLWVEGGLNGWISTDVTVILSIVLTIIITVLMLKVDTGKIAKKAWERLRGKKPEAEANGSAADLA